jgi:NTP pyrophosphatase (non-canonical NTP hydrolase)
VTLVANVESVGQLSVDDLPRVVGEIYGVKDELRSLWDVWLHASHHATAIAQEARRARLRERVLKETADFAFWLFTIVYRIRGDLGRKKPGEDDRQSIVRIKGTLSEILWNRHPGVCPSCYWRRARLVDASSSSAALPELCECAAHPGDLPDGASRRRLSQALRSVALTQVGHKPDSLDLWQKRLGEIYRVYLGTVSLERVVFELLIQMGEVSDAMVRIYSYKADEFVAPQPSWQRQRLEDELGDLFRWLFLVAEKLNSVISDYSNHDLPRSVPQPLRLSWILWDRYGSTSRDQFHCPFCTGSSCVCKHVFVPGSATVDDLVERATDIA